MGGESSSNNCFFTAIWGYLRGMVVQKMQRPPHRALQSLSHTLIPLHMSVPTHTCTYAMHVEVQSHTSIPGSVARCLPIPHMFLMA